MSQKVRIPVHRMDDWNAGIYLKSFGTASIARPDYDLSAAHRHDFYYGVLLEKGNMLVEIDFKEIKFMDLTLFLTYPGQIHRIIKADLERGWFFAFDPGIIDQPLKDILDQCLSDLLITGLDPVISAKFSRSLQGLKYVYDDVSLNFGQQVARALLTAFLYQMLGVCFSREMDALAGRSSRSIAITKNFRKMLRQNFRSEKKPYAYAEMMNVSTGHLNDAIRSITGFSVTYFIQQEVVREAQRMLYYSSLSVKEIALIIGYEDAQYFSRLFSKVAGCSPTQWRSLKCSL